MRAKVLDTTRTHQIRGAYRRPVKQGAASIMRMRYAVRAWWSLRLLAKCQLTNLNDYQLHYDYRKAGTDSWLRAVATAALYSDFLVQGGHDISTNCQRFLACLRPLLGSRVRMVYRPVRLESQQFPGRRFLRPRRSFIIFNKWQEHISIVLGEKQK